MLLDDEAVGVSIGDHRAINLVTTAREIVKRVAALKA